MRSVARGKASVPAIRRSEKLGGELWCLADSEIQTLMSWIRSRAAIIEGLEAGEPTRLGAGDRCDCECLRPSVVWGCRRWCRLKGNWVGGVQVLEQDRAEFWLSYGRPPWWLKASSLRFLVNLTTLQRSSWRLDRDQEVGHIQQER